MPKTLFAAQRTNQIRAATKKGANCRIDFTARQPELIELKVFKSVQNLLYQGLTYGKA